MDMNGLFPDSPQAYAQNFPVYKSFFKYFILQDMENQIANNYRYLFCYTLYNMKCHHIILSHVLQNQKVFSFHPVSFFFIFLGKMLLIYL